MGRRQDSASRLVEKNIAKSLCIDEKPMHQTKILNCLKNFVKHLKVERHEQARGTEVASFNCRSIDALLGLLDSNSLLDLGGFTALFLGRFTSSGTIKVDRGKVLDSVVGVLNVIFPPSSVKTFYSLSLMCSALVQ
ncbi:Uncharacterized protein Rs2_13456 [Raphanus sativus]|nr:Uncharacterized protein Rs2_13456 [Raphanus sativus]